MRGRRGHWSPDELKIVELMKEQAAGGWLSQDKAMYVGVWKDIAEKVGIPEEELKKKWRCMRDCYLSCQKKLMRGEDVYSKFTDGTLSFLDNLLDFGPPIETSKHCRLILPGTSSNSQSILLDDSFEDCVILNRSVTFSIEDIDFLLSTREDGPNIDPATMEFLTNLVSKRLNETLKFNTGSQSTNVPAVLPIEISTVETVSPSTGSVNMPMHIDVEELVTPHVCGLSKEQGINDNKAVANESMKVPQIISTQSLPDPLEVDDSVETVFELHSTRSEMGAFFDDLGDYVMDKFTYNKQMELRLKICAVITQAELEKIEKTEKRRKREIN